MQFISNHAERKTIPDIRSSSKARYVGLDLLKLLCSFLVVYIHIPIPGTLGTAIYSLARIAVPVFFMITGFFYESTYAKKGVKKQLIKIFSLFVLSNLIFFIGNCVETLLYGKSLTQYLLNTFSPDNLLNLLIFNVSPFGVHLWYMGSILYTLIIMAFLFKPKYKKLLWLTVPVLLLVDLVLGQYSKLIFEVSFPVYWVRNFLFVGIPYFLIGNIIFSYKDILLAKISVNKNIILVVTFIITTLFESFLLNAYHLNTARNHYISTTLLAISLFLLSLSVSKKITKIGSYISDISKKTTTWIYILHPFFITFFNIAASVLHIESIFDYVGCFIVFLCVLIFLLVIQNLYARFVRKIIQK